MCELGKGRRVSAYRPGTGERGMGEGVGELGQQAGGVSDNYYDGTLVGFAVGLVDLDCG
jgi:hypothetical protein